MTRPASASELVSQVELAALAGRSLEQIEAVILASSGLDEESQAAVWLYAWCCEEHPLARPFPVPRLGSPGEAGRFETM
jgi:hypothetical protein